jgi:hypothetical protein
MSAVGQSVYDKFVVTAGSCPWAKLDEIYCPHCGEKGKVYTSCGKKDGDEFHQLRDTIVCVGCTYWGNLPSGYCIDSPKTTASPWYMKTIEELRDITTQEAA